MAEQKDEELAASLLAEEEEISPELAASVRDVINIARQTPEKAPLIARELRAVGKITVESTEPQVRSALSAPSDEEALWTTFRQTVSRVADVESFKEGPGTIIEETTLLSEETRKAQERHYEESIVAAEARAVAVKSEILNFGGAPLIPGEVEKRLHISRPALHERRKRGTIIALDVGRHGFLYPQWQFGDGEAGLVSGLKKVLAVLKKEDSWGKCLFLLKKHPRLGWNRPMDLLRKGKLQQVMNVAIDFRTHGA